MSTWNYQKNNGLPVSWKSTPLNYLFTIIGGNGFAPELQGESYGELPFIKNSDISSGASKISTAVNYVSHDLAQKEGFNVVPKNSILMGKIGESMKKNRRVLNTVECCIDNNMQAMVPTVESIHPEYGLYALQLLDAADFDNGGPVPSINNIKWRRARIPLPQKREQILIMAVLNSETAKIDRAIDLLQQELDTLEQLKKSMIHEAVTKGLDPSVPMKPSGVDWIGDIPEHWEAKKLKFIVSFGSGTTPDSSDYSYYDEGEIPWIQSGDLYRTARISRTEKNVTAKAIRELSALTVYRAPFVVVAMYGASVGNTSLSNIDACMNQACCYIRGNDVADNEYLFYAISSAKSDLISKAQGGTQPNISQIVLKNQTVPSPPLGEQMEIVKRLSGSLEAVDSLIELKFIQVNVLKQHRESLIFEYVTGKRRVSEVA